jgi:enoyl-CoA hydratase/carnithine racemase
MNNATPASDHVIVERSGAIVTLTFNRPEARNAMTWEMYERLYRPVRKSTPMTRSASSC